jgi:hypothetical protein
MKMMVASAQTFEEALQELDLLLGAGDLEADFAARLACLFE